MGELEQPQDPASLYRARGDEVPVWRPYLTSDVFSGISLPGFGDKGRDVAILTHPCSMRTDGVTLQPRVLVAEVREETSTWGGHFDRMPLPNARGDERDLAIRFAHAASVQTSLLPASQRWLILSNTGLNLLQQQFVFYLTRCVVETHVLDEASAHVYEEVDIAEDWLDIAEGADKNIEQARQDFHGWIQEDTSAGTRQRQLEDPQRRRDIARQARAEAQRRYVT